MGSRVRMVGRGLAGVMARQQGRCVQRMHARNLLTPSSLPPAQTAQEMIKSLTQTVIGGPRHYDPGVYTKQREELMAILPESQEELPPRRMLDSYDSAIIPLGSDPVLRDRYLNPQGGVRIGRLLEDMDVFSVHLVFKHVLNPKQVKTHDNNDNSYNLFYPGSC